MGFIYDYIKEMKGYHPKILSKIVALPKYIRNDLLFWIQYMKVFPVMKIDNILHKLVYTEFAATDASGSGLGIYYNGVAISGVFSNDLVLTPIHVKEALTVLAAIVIFRNKLTGKNVKLYCDNLAFVCAYANRWSSDIKMMSIVYKLVLICVKFKINLFIEYINTKNNILADLLSRFKYNAFYNYCQNNNISVHSFQQYNDINILYYIKMHEFCNYIDML